jgi:PEP-CTERM motif
MRISFQPMKIGLNTKWSFSVLTVAAALALVPSALAYPLLGTINLADSSSQFVNLVPPGLPAGVLQAGSVLVEPFSYHPFNDPTKITSGTVTTAVFKEGSGTLDFYYQVENDPTSASAVARITESSFVGFLTNVGFRIDGSVTLGAPFVDGTVPPPNTSLADRNVDGSVIGFNFTPPITGEILPGTTSNVFVISTDATMYKAGSLSIIDGGTQTLAAWEPGVPEPGSMLLIGGGLLALAGIRRFRS